MYSFCLRPSCWATCLFVNMAVSPSGPESQNTVFVVVCVTSLAGRAHKLDLRPNDAMLCYASSSVVHSDAAATQAGRGHQRVFMLHAAAVLRKTTVFVTVNNNIVHGEKQNQKCISLFLDTSCVMQTNEKKTAVFTPPTFSKCF